MQKGISFKAKITALLFLLITILWAVAATADKAKVYESELIRSIKEKFNTFYGLAQQDRLYVQTDKSFYKPGETIWFSAYVRDAQTLKPSDNSDIIHVELITPKGTVERHYKIVATDGVALGDFDLIDHPGGVYKIKAYTEWQKNEDSSFRFEKEITVQSVVAPRLKMKLDFEKKAYGKGDEVVAKLELNTNSDKALGNTRVKFKAQLDGRNLRADSAITDAGGKVNLRFSLPADLNTTDGVVNAMIDYDGSTESVSRSIPIVLNKIKLEFFPEGGDMVCGFNNRVAFRATNEFGKPADIEGIIVDSKGEFVTKFSSFHFGMGAMQLSPKTNETYRAHIIKPVGILEEYNLPAALTEGYVLSITGQSNDVVDLSVQTMQPEELSFIAQTRGKIYSSGSFKAVKGINPISLNTADFPIGISQITLFDSKGIERAERLAFVHKDKQLKVAVSTDKAQYKPREQVNMNIKVTDDKGLPVPGRFSLSVVDDNLLSFADDRQGNILSKILLEPELKEKVEEANFYFDPKEPEADMALDLLVLTSGWRHYVWKQIMNGDFPAARYKGEKAEVGGVVYDGTNRRPLPGAVVKLADAKQTVITDEDGKFCLKEVDISSGAELEVIAPYYDEQKYVVYDYSRSNNFYLSKTGIPIEEDKETLAGKMRYQAVIRDEQGRPLPENRRVSLRFKIHSGSAKGKVIWEETNSAITNGFGLVSTYIGPSRGPGDKIWPDGDRYLEIEVDAAGGNNYKNMSTTPLVDIPYALYAANASRSGGTLPAAVVTGSRQVQHLMAETVSVQVIRAENLVSATGSEQKDAAKNKNGAKQLRGQAKSQMLTALEPKPEASARPKMDVAEKPAEPANAKDFEQNPGNGDIDLPEIAAKYGDAQAAAFAAFDKRAETQGKQAVFYRAKEFPVRKYTPSDVSRNDFGSTVYWNGDITTDATGKAKVSFITNDLVSSFKATIEGFAINGSPGHAEYNFSTLLPFVMDTKMPVEMVSGDKMMIPVFLKNSTSSTIHGKLQIVPSAHLAVANSMEEVVLPSNSVKVVYIPASATTEIGDGSLKIKFISEKYTDAIARNIHVVARGFPANISFSGQDLNKAVIIHPENVVPGSMKISFTAYPNIMGELMSGVASILREPGGCFEQTSSSNYPNILALQYLKTVEEKDPDMENKAVNLLDKGYKKLTSFETKENGYEWFGAVPPHEALTAYGLMEFVDMKNVYTGVDQQMIDRTANLLLTRRDGDGGFKKNPKALDGFGRADEDVTNAYIVYALSEAGYTGVIKKELDQAYRNAGKSDDPYIMALCANALLNAGDKTRGEEMISHLLNSRGEVAFWTGKKHSITRSTGESLKVETSALVLLAMMKSRDSDAGAITSTVKFLVEARRGQGGFGSTQATILALKALTRYTEFNRKTGESGTVEIYVNGVPAGSKDYAKGERDNIIVNGIEKYIGEGKQKIEVRFKGCSQALPYTMNIAYNTNLTESSKDCALNITSGLSSTEVKVGETTRLSVTVQNKTTGGLPMTMAIIGLPAGLSAQPWQLKEMQEKGEIDFYEINGNNIAFYYRALAPSAVKQINLDLKADIPGEYSAPVSSAYLYYTNELKSRTALGKVIVKPL